MLDILYQWYDMTLHLTELICGLIFPDSQVTILRLYALTLIIVAFTGIMINLFARDAVDFWEYKTKNNVSWVIIATCYLYIISQAIGFRCFDGLNLIQAGFLSTIWCLAARHILHKSFQTDTIWFEILIVLSVWMIFGGFAMLAVMEYQSWLTPELS